MRGASGVEWIEFMNRLIVYSTRLLVLVGLVVILSLNPKSASAGWWPWTIDSCDNVYEATITGGNISDGGEIDGSVGKMSLTVLLDTEFNKITDPTARIYWEKNGDWDRGKYELQLSESKLTPQAGGSYVVNFSFSATDLVGKQSEDFFIKGFGQGHRKVSMTVDDGNARQGKVCALLQFRITKNIYCTDVEIKQTDASGVEHINPKCIDAQSDITINYTAEEDKQPYEGTLYEAHGWGSAWNGILAAVDFNAGKASYTISAGELKNIATRGRDNRNSLLYNNLIRQNPIGSCEVSFAALQEAACTDESRKKGSWKNQLGAPFELCNQIPESEDAALAACRNCVADQDKVWTAVGCISKEPKDIIAQFITIGLGIGGGVALIMIIAGGFMLTISQGNPQKTNEAKEMITSAIIGLLFVIFSVVILQFIGVTIFRIPGFGEPAAP